MDRFRATFHKSNKQWRKEHERTMKKEQKAFMDAMSIDPELASNSEIRWADEILNCRFHDDYGDQDGLREQRALIQYEMKTRGLK